MYDYLCWTCNIPSPYHHSKRLVAVAIAIITNMQPGLFRRTQVDRRLTARFQRYSETYRTRLLVKSSGAWRSKIPEQTIDHNFKVSASTSTHITILAPTFSTSSTLPFLQGASAGTKPGSTHDPHKPLFLAHSDFLYQLVKESATTKVMAPITSEKLHLDLRGWDSIVSDETQCMQLSRDDEIEYLSSHNANCKSHFVSYSWCPAADPLCSGRVLENSPR